MKPIIRFEVTVPENDTEPVTGFLALHVPFGWEEERLASGATCFRIHNEHMDFIDGLHLALQAAFPEVQCTKTMLEEQDWLSAWRQFFTPVTCGSRFVVLPPWLAETQDFPDRTKVLIEPKSAFGTGHHATTALCLTVLSELLDSGRVYAGQNFLDLGTGSGVLGIACCKSGLNGEGYDIDPLAIDNALENRALNNAEGFLPCIGSIDDLAGRTFDLILANILARPLIEMAPYLCQARKDGGCLVLSGLLTVQANDVVAAYAAQNLPAPRREVDGEWCALVWQ